MDEPIVLNSITERVIYTGDTQAHAPAEPQWERSTPDDAPREDQARRTARVVWG